MSHTDEVCELMAENGRLREAIDASWRRMIAFPHAQVCKHYAALILGTELENRGFEPPDLLVKAIVEADDETALQHETIFAR